MIKEAVPTSETVGVHNKNMTLEESQPMCCPRPCSSLVSNEYITTMLIIFLLMSPNLTSTASACFFSGIIVQTLEVQSPPVTKH
jgi:hypothetical protein